RGWSLAAAARHVIDGSRCGIWVPSRTNQTSRGSDYVPGRICARYLTFREDSMDTQLKLLGRDAPTEIAPIKHLKPSIDPSTLFHRQLLDGAFWQKIPAYRRIDEATFLDHSWQAKNSITNPQKLLQAVQDLVPQSFSDDVWKGFHLAPMSIRISPYLLSLIDWTDAYNDPLRRQFVP